MSEGTPETGATQAAEPQQQPEQRDPKDMSPWEREGVDFDPEKAWKLLKNTRKDLEAAKSRVSEFEQERMSEVEKANARAEAAEKALAQKDKDLLRHRIAAEKGVPAELLSGDTEDEIAERASQLLAFRGNTPVRAPSYDGGDRGSAAPTDDFGALLKRQIAGRR